MNVKNFEPSEAERALQSGEKNSMAQWSDQKVHSTNEQMVTRSGKVLHPPAKNFSVESGFHFASSSSPISME